MTEDLSALPHLTDRELEMERQFNRTSPSPENVDSRCRAMCACIPYLLRTIDTLRGHEAEQPQGDTPVRIARGGSKVCVKVGDSVLSRDLVWCSCGRGLSRSGTWEFCPKCGSEIDQKSYQDACTEAERNSAHLFYSAHDAELVNELSTLRAQMEGMKREWRPKTEDPAQQSNTWTTRAESEVADARKRHPWMTFQSRLVSDWKAAEVKEQAGE